MSLYNHVRDKEGDLGLDLRGSLSGFRVPEARDWRERLVPAHGNTAGCFSPTHA
jgi:hypothetical protein